MPSRTRRAKWPASLPKPPENGGFPYAKSREELRDLDEGRITRLVIESEAWQDVMTPILDALDESDVKRQKRGPQRSYSAHELESVLVFQRVCGLNSYKEARDRLASDRHGETRRLLGFELPRATPNKLVRLTQGLPSEASVSRHRQRFGLKRRRAAYQRLFERLVAEHLRDPVMAEEARILNLDGTHLLTHYRCPGPGSLGEAVTCPDGGWVPPSPDNPWRTHGHGFNLLVISTATGLPLIAQMTKINDSERPAAVAVVKEFGAKCAAHLPEKAVGVMSADGGINSPALRKEAREVGLLENVHLASHSRRRASANEVRERNKRRYLIDGYPDWFANGHRELFCRCGQGTVSRVVKRHKGRVVARNEGRCSTCGTVSITSGRWRFAKNVNRRGQGAFRRCMPGDRHGADWAFGNPLTFNDPLAMTYGSARFGHQEGFFGQLVTRFGILREKGWYRGRAEAELDVAMTFSIIHVLAMEQRRRARDAERDDEPLPLAA